MKLLNFSIKNKNRIWVVLLLVLTSGCEQVTQFLSSEEVEAKRKQILSAGKYSPSLYTCTQEDAPQDRKTLRRLSKVEYRNTLYALTSFLNASDRTSLWNDLQALITLVPEDASEQFKDADVNLTQGHSDRYYDIAKEFADFVVASNSRMTALVGHSCITAASPATACIDYFIDQFGLKTHRRPITSSERTIYRNFFNAETNPVRALIIRFLMSPEFLYHVELSGADIGNDTLELTSYEFASRLSYAYLKTMPDSTLFSMAADNSILTDTGLESALDHLLDNQRTLARQVSADFYNQWLHLNEVPGINTSNTNAFSSFAPTFIGQEDALRDAMIEEIEDFTDLQTWDWQGSVDDLYQSRSSVTQSSLLASLYGVSTWNGAGNPPQFDESSDRSGLLSRAGMLVSGIHETGPIHRGVHIRRDILCDDLPDPPTDLPPNSIIPPPFDPSLTTRERTAQKTSPAQCAFCHSQINPLGFILERFDGLGRERSQEQIIYSNGSLGPNHSINTAVAPNIYFGDTETISSQKQMVERMISSKKLNLCFVKKYYMFLEKKENIDQNQCVLKGMYDALDVQGGSIYQMLRAYGRQPALRLKKI
ncbi:MAG: hypothetical protein CL678_16220 [Bdellovibrionaceae bacterium]|nr:hypothetical protein [Pseudobdellovibrionaceae bacterium]